MKHATIQIHNLSHDGRGVGQLDGKTVFVANAVPGDEVTIRLTQQQKNYDEAALVSIETPSPDRVSPFCVVYEQCGGCQLQHLSLSAQRRWKAEHFLTALFKAVNGKQCEVVAPLVGNDQQYRRRARLVLGKTKSDKSARLGFRAQQTNEIVDIEQCPLFTKGLNKKLTEKRTELLPLASRNLKQVELVEAENGVFCSTMMDVKQQPEAAESAQNSDTISENIALPYYSLSGVRLQFAPDGFVQVNADINQKMVAQAIDWLAVEPQHQVLDLFCGMGNFALPLANRCAKVVGVEGELSLVQMAKDNASLNTLKNATFYKADLFSDTTQMQWFYQQQYQRVLLDPGRQGALAICEQMSKLKAEVIVYVSCNAATLIRDVKVLEKQDYQLVKAGFMDMFPHTSHAEVMVKLVKVRKPKKKPNRKVFRL